MHVDRSVVQCTRKHCIATPSQQISTYHKLWISYMYTHILCGKQILIPLKELFLELTLLKSITKEWQTPKVRNLDGHPKFNMNVSCF